MVMSVVDLAEGEEILEVLEGAYEALPMVIFMVKMAIAIGRREIRAQGLESLLDVVDVPTETVAQPA